MTCSPLPSRSLFVHEEEIQTSDEVLAGYHSALGVPFPGVFARLQEMRPTVNIHRRFHARTRRETPFVTQENLFKSFYINLMTMVSHMTELRLKGPVAAPQTRVRHCQYVALRQPRITVTNGALYKKTINMCFRRNIVALGSVGVSETQKRTTPATTSSLDYFMSLIEGYATANAGKTPNLIPLYSRIMGDQLTPILAYKSLVSEEHDKSAPSFLFESVVNGTQQGRYSFVGARPLLEIVSKGHSVEIIDHGKGTTSDIEFCKDPLAIPEDLSKDWRPAVPNELPRVFTGGWVGYCGYDTVRYVYQGKLPFEHAPKDDRNLPDMHLALYTDTVLFDHATKLAYAVSWVNLDDFDSVEAAFQHGKDRLDTLTRQLQQRPNLAFGRVDLSLQQRPNKPKNSNFTEQEFMQAIEATKEHILSGDVFQLVLSQRFERKTTADPFEVYRALRVVNPSPYMAYLQSKESIIVSSSPEILCRVEESRRVTNRPLAGTRRRGATEEEDQALEKDLLQDEKELAEHVMLVDLGRNDVGKVAQAGTVKVDKLMEIERYSHVMHISSTVTGQLKTELSCWDALRAALPAGTVSGAPKVRAMQILDELEHSKRGPYGGGFGHVSFTGGMDMALALRTMVVVNDVDTTEERPEWTIHLQAGAGVVMDSVPESEFEETVNKAAALGRAIDLAESSFVYNQEDNTQ